MASYVELQVTSHFSFLRGASLARGAVRRRGSYRATRRSGCADWGSVAGVVRGWDGQKATGVRMIPGARVETDRWSRAAALSDGPPCLVAAHPHAVDRQGARVGRAAACSTGRRSRNHAEGLVAILLPDEADATTAAQLDDLPRRSARLATLRAVVCAGAQRPSACTRSMPWLARCWRSQRSRRATSSITPPRRVRCRTW
jgi:error-prone DNA polymerase